MKILLLSPEIFSDGGGIPRILRLYLKALCDLPRPENSVRLVTLNDATVDSPQLRAYSSRTLLSWHACDRKKIRFIRAALRMSKSCDTIICGHIAQAPVALAAKILNPRIQYSIIAHGIEVWRPFNPAEYLALRFCKNVICISAATRDRMREHCKLPLERMPVLPNCLDPFFEIAEEPPQAPSAPVICAVARLSSSDRYKGIDSLIEALPIIHQSNPNVRLSVIGDGDDAQRLRRLANKLNLGKNVEMTGFVSDATLRARLRACALFALPSKEEGFGLVFLEAMAQGKPCLGARSGGIPEVVSAETGILVEYGNIQQIASAVLEILDRKWDPAAIKQHARAFSFDVFRDRLHALVRTS